MTSIRIKVIKMRVTKCKQCGTVYLYKVSNCPNCFAENKEKRKNNIICIILLIIAFMLIGIMTVIIDKNPGLI